MNKQISEFSDVELGLMINQYYQQLEQVKVNLMLITQELNRRLPPPVTAKAEIKEDGLAR